MSNENSNEMPIGEAEYLIVGVNVTPSGAISGEYHAVKQATTGAGAAQLACDSEESYGRLLHVIGVYRDAGSNLRHSQ